MMWRSQMRRRNATPKVGGPGQAEELRGASQKATIRMGALVCRKRRLHPPLLADVLQPMRRRLGDALGTDGGRIGDALETDGGRIGDGAEHLRDGDSTLAARCYEMQTRPPQAHDCWVSTARGRRLKAR